MCDSLHGIKAKHTKGDGRWCWRVVCRVSPCISTPKSLADYQVCMLLKLLQNSRLTPTSALTQQKKQTCRKTGGRVWRAAVEAGTQGCSANPSCTAHRDSVRLNQPDPPQQCSKGCPCADHCCPQPGQGGGGTPAPPPRPPTCCSPASTAAGNQISSISQRWQCCCFW